MKDVVCPKTDAIGKQPKVSVVMAIHNEEAYGPAAIQSILDQTFDDFEFIIIDDASTDATPEMLAEFAASDSRIKIITNDENLSVPLSANRGLAEATGEYIARMDSDDIAYPNRFAEQVAFLGENPDYIIVGGGIEYIDGYGNVFRTFDRGSQWWEFEWSSFFRAPLAQPCAMFRADAMRKHNLFYDNEFNRAADFEYWHRILRCGKGCELPSVHLQYRIHDRNISVIHKDRQRQVARRAAKENMRCRYPDIADADVAALLDFLFSNEPPRPGQLTNAIDIIGELESLYLSERSLSQPQADDVRRITAKILLKATRDFAPMRNTAMAADVFYLLRRYFSDYCAVACDIVQRRVRLPRAI